MPNIETAPAPGTTAQAVIPHQPTDERRGAPVYTQAAEIIATDTPASPQDVGAVVVDATVQVQARRYRSEADAAQGADLWAFIETAQTTGGQERDLALQRFCEGTYVTIVRYAYSLVGDLETARDITQHTYLKFIGSLGGYEPKRDNPIAILYATARHLVMDRADRKYSFDPTDPDDKAFSTPERPGVTLTSPVEEDYERYILSPETTAILASLKPEHAKVLKLRFLLEYENEQVADMLEISVGAVKALQKRALDAAHRQVAGHGSKRERTRRL